MKKTKKKKHYQRYQSKKARKKKARRVNLIYGPIQNNKKYNTIMNFIYNFAYNIKSPSIHAVFSFLCRWQLLLRLIFLFPLTTFSSMTSLFTGKGSVWSVCVCPRASACVRVCVSGAWGLCVKRHVALQVPTAYHCFHSREMRWDQMRSNSV